MLSGRVKCALKVKQKCSRNSSSLMMMNEFAPLQCGMIDATLARTCWLSPLGVHSWLIGRAGRSRGRREHTQCVLVGRLGSRALVFAEKNGTLKVGLSSSSQWHLNSGSFFLQRAPLIEIGEPDASSSSSFLAIHAASKALSQTMIGIGQEEAIIGHKRRFHVAFVCWRPVQCAHLNAKLPPIKKFLSPGRTNGARPFRVGSLGWASPPHLAAVCLAGSARYGADYLSARSWANNYSPLFSSAVWPSEGQRSQQVAAESAYIQR